MTEQETIRDILKQNETHVLAPADAYRLIPQQGVTHTLFPSEVRHNAMWDFTVTDEGRVFFSLCAELNEALYARLYEYIPESDTLQLHFNLEDKILQFDRAVRMSKIHSSICKMNDGRLIMATHTTATSPCHPHWMPEAYYHHLWEGYQGSNIILYDPNTGALENRGVPIPHESIYGGIYDAMHHAFFFTGYFRGHLYRLDITTNAVQDFGRVTEYGSFRLHIGPDGHVYGNSRSGNYYRVRTDTLEIQELGELPYNWGKLSQAYRQVHFAANGPDGNIYMGVYYCSELVRFCPDTGALEMVGSYRPKSYIFPCDVDCVAGMTFDDEGVLWYAIQANFYPQDTKASTLCSWDVTRGGEPVCYGILGTDKRAVGIVSEMHFYKGKLYLSDSNHGDDAPGVMTIDLAQLKAAYAKTGLGPITGDAYVYWQFKNAEALFPGKNFAEKAWPYARTVLHMRERGAFLAKNHDEFFAKELTFLRVWREVTMRDSPVRRVHWLDDDTLVAQCTGGEKTLRLTVTGGKLTAVEETEAFPQEAVMPQALKALSYPCVPGRQYKAVPTAFCPLSGGSYLVGTQDGLLARVKNGKVFSLGACAPNGPVRALCTDTARSTVYGVAGDEMDLGCVFRYDDENGLVQLGRVFANSFETPAILGSSELSCCALSPDGSTLAIGAQDRMGMLYFYKLR
ncbi:MAG: hypothetical protein RSG59_04025 [Ruthenibacterium sp.]